MQAARLRVRVKVPVSPAGSARMVTVCTSGRLMMIPVRRKEEGGMRNEELLGIKEEGGMRKEEVLSIKEEGGRRKERERSKEKEVRSKKEEWSRKEGGRKKG